MYLVKYGSEWLHDPRVEGVLLSTLSFEADENTCGYCTFHISTKHPLYGKLEQRNNSKLITIYDDKLSMKDPYFQGYIYSIETNMQLTAEVKCKGILAYLGDASVRPYSTLADESLNVAPSKPFLYFRWLLNQYNSQMGSNKAFVEGENQANALDANNYFYRANSGYSTVAKEIQDKLLDELGGYLSVRYEGGKRYLDYVADFDKVNTQILDFGVNLLDFTRTDDSDSVITSVIPLGASMKDTEYVYLNGYYLTSDKTPNKDKTYYSENKYEKCADGMSTFTAGVKYYELLNRKTYARTKDTKPDTFKTYYTLGSWSEQSKLLYFTYGVSYYERSGKDEDSYRYRKTGDAKPNYSKKYYTRSYSSVTGLAKWEGGVLYYELASDVSWYVRTKDTAPIFGKVYYQSATSGSLNKCEGLSTFDADKTYYEYSKALDESDLKLTIEDIPDGELNSDLVKSGDHVYSREAVSKYGFIYGTYENKDITVSENLLSRGVAALGGLLSPKTTIEVKAVDLSLINPNLKPIRIGEYVRVRSEPHGFDSYMLCRDVDLNLVNPENSKYTLGFTYDTITGQANSKINALNETVNHVYQTTDTISQEAKDAAQSAAEAAEKATEASNKADESQKAADEATITAQGAQDTADTALEQIANLKGKFLYIRYSANADGNSFTDAPTAATKYMGIYSGDSETAPENASDYVWTLIKGSDGVGVQGADGKPAYLHIKYSDDGVTFTANNGETAGAWLGTYSDHTEADSTTFNDYTWAKVKGEQGEQGLRGLQGERGEQGIAGAAGSDGQSSYFHIKYSPVAAPTASQMTETPDVYIGTYVDNTAADSTSPSKYTWARFQGLQGEQGIAGVGEDGKTSYLHIKYSDNGTSFTSNSGETVGAYIGTCVDFNSADPTTFSSYKWAKIKGEQGEQGLRGLQGERGEQGIPGSAGEDGRSSYFHVKYSPVDNPTASQMTEDTNTYIGTYVDYTEADSTDPTKYKWVRLEGLQGEKGDQGIPGVGVDGKTSYLHIKYSNDNGATFTANSGETVGTYIGTCTDFTQNDPTTVSSYKWALIKGADGSDGEQGVSCTNVVEQYYLSTSSAKQSGGSWVTTCPAWESGKYIWTRSEVTWSDDSVTHTEPVLANALNTANSTAADASDTANAAQQVASDAQTGVDNIVAGKPLLTTWAGDGQDGYVYIGDITYNGSWLNQPIKLNISQRGISSYNVIFRWENTDGNQSVETLTTSRKDVSVVSVQWDYQHTSLFVLKSESYDSVSVMKVENVYEPTEVQVLLGSDDEIYQLADLQSYSTVGVVVSSVDEECATNYMEFVDGEGLVVGNMTEETLGKNTLIDAEGMAIRSGETELARFGDDEIHLGMNSTNSIIDLCNGSGSISGNANGSAGLSLKGTGLTEIGGYRSTDADPSDFCGMRIDEDGNTEFHGESVSIQNSIGNKKVVIDDDSVDIVSSGNTVASFGKDITLGYVDISEDQDPDDYTTEAAINLINVSGYPLGKIVGRFDNYDWGSGYISIESNQSITVGDDSNNFISFGSNNGVVEDYHVRISSCSGISITYEEAHGIKFNNGGLPIASGGTGATTAADARTNLEITPANIGAAAEKATAGTYGGICVARGMYAARSVAAGSYVDIAVTFSGKYTFPSTPTVVASLVAGVANGTTGACSVSVTNLTTTGCTLRLHNNYTSARNIGASYIAIYN